jgi:hypothetical protein
MALEWLGVNIKRGVVFSLAFFGQVGGVLTL